MLLIRPRIEIKLVNVIEDACSGSSPHPQTTPPSNLRILCDHLHPSHGSAGRGQGENNCNDFRCEFFLLDKTSAATNAEVHEKSNAEIRFFCDFGMIWGVRGLPRDSSEDGAREGTKTSAVAVHFGELFWTILGPKSDFCAFRLCQFLCLFLASLLGGLRSQF